MTTADKFEWPTGDPLFEVSLRALSEGIDGNGVVSPGDLKVTATANADEISVAAGTVWYNGASYSEASATTFTLTAADSTYDRWDLVYYDTATPGPAVRDGTAESDPEPPDLQADEVLIAYVYRPSGATDVSNAQIKNWRAMSGDADEVRLIDSAGDYSSATVEGAFTEVVREAGDPLNGPLDLSGFSGSAPFDLGTNPGAFGPVVDMVVDSNSAAGTAHSFLFAVDANTVLQVYTESDGAGGVQNTRVEVPVPLRMSADVTDDRGNVLYDYSANVFSQARLGGPASSLTSYPLPIGDLNTPYGLPAVTDMDAAGTDLTDSNGPGVLYDASVGEFPRSVLDDEAKTTVVTSSTYTTSDEELILVDTAAIAATSTITLASADAEAGHETVVVDISGSASTYPISVETEGTETINGGSSYTISTDYTGASFSSDGSNWVTASPAPIDPKTQVEGAESGSVAAGEQGTLIFDNLADGETLNVYKAIFTLDDGTAVPTGLDLVIATLDNSGSYTVQKTIFAGDGSTIWDGGPSSRGDPLISWTNGTGAATTVAVLANNTTSSAYSIMSKVTGERVP